MKRTLILLLVGIIATESACSMSKETAFFANFSMRDLVTNNKSIKRLQCEPAGEGGGGGGGSIFSVGAGKGGTHFQSHKSDSFACRLQSGSLPRADEEQLIASLRKQVEDSLQGYGARINETGSRGPVSFYVSYADRDIQGRIQVSGTRSGVDFYTLQAVLDESK